MAYKNRGALILRIMGNLLMVASLAFIVRSIIKSNIDINTLFRPGVIVAVFGLGALIAAGLFFMAEAWKCIIEAVSGNKQNYLDVAIIYTRANLGKYLPGNVMHMIMRNTMADKIEAKPAEIALSTLLEQFFLLLVGFICAIILSWDDLFLFLSKYMEQRHHIFIIAALGITVALIVAVFLWKSKLFRNLRNIGAARIFRLFSICFIYYGSMLTLFAITMIINLSCYVHLTPSSMFRVFSAYMISWVIGFVVIGAPAGLGIREAAFIFFMGGNGNGEQEILLSAVVLNRVTTTLGDILASVAGTLLKRHHER